MNKIEYLYDLSKEWPEATPDLFGGKGYHLNRMFLLGIPVPMAFVLPTTIYPRFKKAPKGTITYITKKIIPAIKKQMVAQFGYMPLLSVRSGAKFSMPGMMDTVLNIGLDANTSDEWTGRLGANCTLDSYLRLVEMYSDVVHGIDRKLMAGRDLLSRLELFEEKTGESFPPADAQLLEAILAVLRSWDNPRAKKYRDLNNIPHDLGTAIVVQAMVFGNMNDQSCAGVLFTRNPNSGASVVTGEFLPNAQGEDVVAGLVTPRDLATFKNWSPTLNAELFGMVRQLEETYRNMLDIEFTVQDGKLYILQCRVGKRTTQAAIRIASEMVDEGLIDEKEMIRAVSFEELLKSGVPIVSPTFHVAPSAIGLPASNGVVSGVPVFCSEDAVSCNEACILITKETHPDDIAGISAAKGVLTETGGATSHAAVVARGMNRPCIVGCDGIIALASTAKRVTIDGSTGRVWLDVQVPIVEDTEHSSVMERFTKAARKIAGHISLVTRIEDVRPTGCWVMVDALRADADALKQVFKTMESGVIDLSPEWEHMALDDRGIAQMFWSAYEKDPVGLLCSLGGKQNVFVIGGTKQENKLLEANGYSVAPIIDSVNDLILHNGPALTGKGLVVDEVTKKVMQMKAAIGEKVIPVRLSNDSLPVSGELVGMNDIVALRLVMKEYLVV